MIQFCDKKAFVMNDIDLHYYSYQPRFKYIDLKDSSILEEPHLVTLETNGIPFTLYLITIKGKKYCIMYDEKLKQSLCVKFRFHSELYKGSVFKGDLRKNEHGQWFFYIHDITYYKGDVCMKTLSQKLTLIYDILKNFYKWDEYMNICQIRIRSFFLYEHLEKVRDEVVYFYPDKGNTIYKWSKNENYQKKQNEKKSTILAEIHKTEKPDVYQVYYENEFLGNALLRGMKLSKDLFHLFKGREKYNIECKFNDRFQKWEPIKWSEHSGGHLPVVEVNPVVEAVEEPAFEVLE